jgi:hypothetical protein
VTDELIKKRCVVFVGDYDPASAEQRFAAFQQGLRQFAQTWHVAVRTSPVKVEADGAVAVWNVETKAPNWQVATEFRLLDWSDVVKDDFRRWTFGRAGRALKALANFIVSGTCWRYLRTNWRFGLLFLYPVLAVLLFTRIALWLAELLSSLNVPFALLAGLTIGAGLFAVFVKWLDPFDMGRIVDLWVFLYELVHLERTGLAERLGAFSQDIVAKLKANDYDEIIVIGHGIGAALQPIILDRTFFALPEFGKGDGRTVSVMSVGSLLLAVGLHPEGTWLVSPTLRLAIDRWVAWVDYQADEDVLGFPGCNPLTVLTQEHGKPTIEKIRIKDMIDTAATRRFARYRAHRQPIEANTKRYFYDYFMICCGPFALPTRIKHPDLMVSAFGPDGALVSRR